MLRRLELGKGNVTQRLEPAEVVESVDPRERRKQGQKAPPGEIEIARSRVNDVVSEATEAKGKPR